MARNGQRTCVHQALRAPHSCPTPLKPTLHLHFRSARPAFAHCRSNGHLLALTLEQKRLRSLELIVSVSFPLPLSLSEVSTLLSSPPSSSYPPSHPFLAFFGLVLHLCFGTRPTLPFLTPLQVILPTAKVLIAIYMPMNRLSGSLSAS